MVIIMDAVFYNGNIVTMDSAIPHAQAVAVKNGIILRVGSNEDILSLAGDKTQRFDLEGRLTLPGFIDSHLHLLSYGYSLEKVALGGCKSREELVAEGRRFVEAHPDLRWIQGRGWNNDMWDDPAFPTRHDLDRISTTVPITFTRACGHIIIANSRAIEAMGVTADTPQIPGGQFDLDAQGVPLGIFREEARDFVYRTIPALSEADIRRMLINGGQKAWEHGITSMQTDDFEAVTEREQESLLKAFRGLAAEGRLPVRVFQQCLVPPVARLRDFIAQGNVTGAGDDFFKIGPLKLLCDGSLGGRTALLRKPYADDPSTRGIAVYTQDELDELVATAHDAGMTVALHAIGDGCIDMCLDAIEKATTGNPLPDMRHSIIHCQITDAAQLRRFRDLNVVAHIQPIFIDYDMHIVASRVGEDLARTSYNWKTLADLGVHYACGSDCPVEPFNVLHGIYAAVTRMDMNGHPKNGWLPDQRLTVQQAVQGYTMGGAWASYEDGIKGSITVGKLADMAVLDRDIFAIPPQQIKDAAVDITILAGNVVYQREP